jgi:hypothetical protein
MHVNTYHRNAFQRIHNTTTAKRLTIVLFKFVLQYLACKSFFFFEFHFYNSLLADYGFTCMTEHIDVVTANIKDINPFFETSRLFQRHNLILYLQDFPSAKSIGSISLKLNLNHSFKADFQMSTAINDLLQCN